MADLYTLASYVIVGQSFMPADSFFRAVSIRRTAGVANDAMTLLDLDNMED